MALDRGVASRHPRPQPPPKTVQSSPDNFLFFVLFLILFYSKKRQQHREATKNQQYWENEEGKKGGKVLPSFQKKDIFSVVSTSKVWAFLFYFFSCSLCSFLHFFSFNMRERSSAVNMQDKEWLTQLLTRQLTMLWSHIIFSWPPAPPPLYSPPNFTWNKTKKKSFIFHKPVCIFHNILLLSFLINTNRHCDSKRKNNELF